MPTKETTFSDVSREKAQAKAVAFMEKNAGRFVSMKVQTIFTIVTDEPEATEMLPPQTKPKLQHKKKPEAPVEIPKEQEKPTETVKAEKPAPVEAEFEEEDETPREREKVVTLAQGVKGRVVNSKR